MNGFKTLLAGVLAVPLGLAAAPADAQDWPTRQVNLVTHSSPGGGGDVMLRNLAPTIENKFGVSTTVDNRVGGSGAVAMTWMATQANPDGYTLLSVTPTQLITPLRAEGIPSYEDLTPIARLFLDPTTLYVHRNSPIETIEEFLEEARANPRGLTVGIGSAGSLDQLVLQNFMAATDIEVRTVPHEGGGDAVLALLGEHVDAVVGEPGQALTHLEDGTLRMITVFQDERLDAYPDVPTLSEVGYDVVSNKFRGIFGPPNMDPDLVEAIAEALGGLYQDEPWNTYWVEGSLNPAFLGPDDFKANLDVANEELRSFIESLN
ncbi:Bug family tripartite tricarboxylate transporter substrate binding protein [Alkalilacustris brevis]|uniref:Bug family tripartite tricarboxylate transporter substrate binding protein n=1 Tax=Alkalilacustris brevis TaxID=2026338 RepID=UPI00138FAFCB|nr:tripartite tricarboxylate transporter substrate binding protein [Alkalilacustris brevis]